MERKDRELMERYIYAVVRRLPKEQRDEVALELTELIEDMAEEETMGDFIKTLYELNCHTWHQFLIATHSALILTDAMYEQLHLLDNRSDKRTEVCNIETPTFAAQRDEISKQIFGAEAIGAFAADAVNRMMLENDLEKMKENIGRVGPGYQRFRLHEQLYDMLEQTKE